MRHGVAVALVVLVFAAAAAHGIGSIWLWGHDGHNGAAWSQAARNTLRFSTIAPTPYYSGYHPPGAADIYYRHPPLLCLHIATAFLVFGEQPWAARLVPFLYSVGTLLLLLRVGRRHFGPRIALLAAAIYALVPLHLIFASMPNHEQGTTFWSLLAVALYLRWREQGGRRPVALCLAALSVACQTGWPGYYVAGLLGADATLYASRTPRRRRAALGTAGLLAATALANATLFLVHHLAVRGDLRQLAAGFEQRSSRPPGYAAHVLRRSLDLYGALPLLLLAAWVGWTAARAWRGRLRGRDLVPAVFLASQAIHSTVFANAGAIHVYWTYFAGVGVALGGASVVAAAADTARARLGRAATPLCLGLVLAFLIVQGAFAARQLRWGRATGCAAYPPPGQQDEWEEHLLARVLGEAHRRDGVAYVVHEAMPHLIHMTYYLDAPQTVRGDAFPGRADPRGPTVFLAEPARLAPAQRQRLAALGRRARMTVWDRRFVSVDTSGPPGSLAARKLVSEQPTWLWTWLVSATRPPARWADDPQPEEARRAVGLE